jgi:hypothetical protein
MILKIKIYEKNIPVFSFRNDFLFSFSQSIAPTTSGSSVVYFTRDISSEDVMKLFQ